MGNAGLERVRLVGLAASVQLRHLPGEGLVLGLEVVVVGVRGQPVSDSGLKRLLRGNGFKCFCHGIPSFMATKKQARVAC